MSRETLIEALKGFKGTIVLSSHDTPFVREVATESYTLNEGVLSEVRTAIAPAGGGGGKGKKNK
ncbi:hypothetical protein EON80_11395 [bacterium]|nr:MAG: hypothetical protein EON80_11395 [bacterium]